MSFHKSLQLNSLTVGSGGLTISHTDLQVKGTIRVNKDTNILEYFNGTNWCNHKGDQYPCGISIFGRRLQERGVQKTRKNTGVVYLDKSLKDNKYTGLHF